MKRKVAVVWGLLCVMLVISCSALAINHSQWQSEMIQLENEIAVLSEENGAIKSISLEQQSEIEQLHNEIQSLQRENNHLAANLKEEHAIDRQYHAAMSNWFGVTMEGVDILVTYGNLWKNEMEKYYQLLYDGLEDERKQWLVSSQEQWQIFTKENEELSWQVYDQIHHMGSIMRIIEAQIYLERYRLRALFLKYLYEYVPYS